MAGSADNNGGDGMIQGINITPLVDIVLVLLIIFIVTAKIIVTPSVPMDLPAASETEEVQVVFSVILPASGPTLCNGEPVYSDEQLRERAARALADDPRVRAVIHADGGVPHRRVIAALDAVKRAGVVKVAFAAKALEEGG
ncbi:MAG: biopolymer transporter ExbD [Nannocystaceae bacterium]